LVSLTVERVGVPNDCIGLGEPAMADFRKLAEECVRMAHTATKPEDRAVLLDIAGRWLKLAAQNDKTAKLAAKVAAMKRLAS
jgi:hypothetical protein